MVHTHRSATGPNPRAWTLTERPAYSPFLVKQSMPTKVLNSSSADAALFLKSKAKLSRCAWKKSLSAVIVSCISATASLTSLPDSPEFHGLPKQEPGQGSCCPQLHNTRKRYCNLVRTPVQNIGQDCELGHSTLVVSCSRTNFDHSTPPAA